MDVVAEDKLSSPFVTKCGQGAIIINFLHHQFSSTGCCSANQLSVGIAHHTHVTPFT